MSRDWVPVYLCLLILVPVMVLLWDFKRKFRADVRGKGDQPHHPFVLIDNLSIQGCLRCTLPKYDPVHGGDATWTHPYVPSPVDGTCIAWRTVPGDGTICGETAEHPIHNT